MGGAYGTLNFASINFITKNSITMTFTFTITLKLTATNSKVCKKANPKQSFV